MFEVTPGLKVHCFDARQPIYALLLACWNWINGYIPYVWNVAYLSVTAKATCWSATLKNGIGPRGGFGYRLQL